MYICATVDVDLQVADSDVCVWKLMKNFMFDNIVRKMLLQEIAYGF